MCGIRYSTTEENMKSNIQQVMFRPAEKKDANEAAQLIHIAIDDIAEQLTGETSEEYIQKTLAQFFQKENNRLSYQNVLVADVLGMVAGMVLTYPGEGALQLDAPIIEHLREKGKESLLDKEADEGDFYIDTLCVHSKFRGYGIGTALIMEAEKLALQKGYQRVSLNVAIDNPSAKKLYEHIGFKKEKVIEIHGHPYDYMVKKSNEV